MATEPANPTTNVPAPTFTAAGFVAPSEQDILVGVQADLNAAFGGGLNPALNTPQGQLASSMTAVVGNANDTFVYFTNQTDPAFATGRMQDGIARIYFLERNAATATQVQATCTGLPGVVIPIGAQAVATDGSIYACTLAGVIGNGGSVTLPFQNNTTGPIPCPQGTLNQIFTTIPGWSGITNPAPGVEGSAAETRSQFELRRQQSVAANGAGALPNVLGAVLSVSGVLDAYVTENTTNGTVSVGGVTLAANSIYVAAVGGNSQQVATAIWSKKAPGCSYTGNTSVTVYDANSGYQPPLPSYIVKYTIPTPLTISAHATLVTGPTVPSDAQAQVRNAILGAFAGADGGPRARIGTQMLASRYYVPVTSLGSWVNIFFIAISSPLDADSVPFTGSMSGGFMTVTAVTGTLSVGALVFDGSGVVAAGSVILAQLSGTIGSTGVYTIANSQTLGSLSLIADVPDDDFVDPRIDQVPVIDPANIIVNLIAPL